MKAVVLFADGFEEVEGITQVDFLKRAGVTVSTVSISNDKMVTGNFGIPLQTDMLLSDFDDTEYDMIILPGGVKGMENLKASHKVTDLLLKFYHAQKWVAAICAAPVILGSLGILKNKKATCYPGFEHGLSDATIVNENVVVDGTVITSKGPGTSNVFALKLIEVLCGKETSDDIAKKTQLFQ